LFVLSCWLLAHKKSVKFTLIPAIFMLVTTVAALIWQCVKYIVNKDVVLLIVTIMLLGLAVFMIIEIIRATLIRRRAHA